MVWTFEMAHCFLGEIEPTIPDSLSEDGKSFLKSCFAHDPQERPSAHQLLNHPWLRIQHQPMKTPKKSVQFTLDKKFTDKPHRSFSLSPEKNLVDIDRPLKPRRSQSFSQPRSFYTTPDDAILTLVEDEAKSLHDWSHEKKKKLSKAQCIIS
jgi:serine/threonine protein kinase